MRERGALDRKVSVFKAWSAADAAIKEAEAGAKDDADPEMRALYQAEVAAQAAEARSRRASGSSTSSSSRTTTRAAT